MTGDSFAGEETECILEVLDPDSPPESAILDLRVPPDPSLVPTVRRFVADLCARVLGDADVTARAVVAAHELFDNALRHATAGEARLRAEIRRFAGDEGEIVLGTENAVAPDREAPLRAVLEAIRASAERAAFYQELLRRVARRGGGGAVGLGLGRIHGEAELALSGSVESGLARLEARGRFPLRIPR